MTTTSVSGRLTTALLLVLIVVTPLTGQTIQDTQSLMATLLTGYSRDVRPIEDQSKPVVVNITFSLVAIQEFDEVSETFTTIGVMNLEWFDPRMTWNPALYNNTYTINIRTENVWLPDLILSSPKESIKVLADRQEWMNVRYVFDGHAYWSPGDVFQSACSVDVTYYPFDVQTCEMMFLPWGLSANEVYLQATSPEALLEYFSENGEWILSRTKTYSLAQTDFSYYTVEITIERRAAFFLVNVVLPIIFMTFLNVLVFWLPAESGERVSYAITVLLAIAVFLTIVGDNMPKTSKPMSILCYFLVINLILSALICVAAIFNLNIYFRHWDHPVPQWLDTMTRILNRKKRSKKTPVDEITLDQLDEEIGTQQMEKKKPTKGSGKWAEVVGEITGSVPPESRDEKPVNWREVSCAIDKVFGTVSVLWIILSSTTFIIMVATHTAPAWN